MVDVVLGLQYGDEGKGKVVDLLAKDYDMVVRAQGGNNAGHTIVINGKTTTLHLLPSGVLYPHTKNIIGSGVVVDIEALLGEIEDFGEDLNGRLFISDRAHVVLPTHKRADIMREKDASKAIGTTKKGIGPCYGDKTLRLGIRMVDLYDLDGLAKKLALYYNKKDAELNLAMLEGVRDRIVPYIADTLALLHGAHRAGERILIEGAQGSMLDVDFGTYPYVTSSNTTISGILGGTGFSHKDINKVIGIAKAYCTRVGNGPFISEDSGEYGEFLREKGHEYGSTTKRPRRCGWYDSVMIRHIAKINGVDEIFLMKLDVLDGIKELKVCTGYKHKGGVLGDIVPTLYEESSAIYESMPTFDNSYGARSFDALEAAARDYIEFLEEKSGVKIAYISTSPERDDYILRG